MNKDAGIKKLLLLSGLATVLSALFGFLGAPLVRVLRNVYGARTFWSIGTFFFVVFIPVSIPLAFYFGTTWLVVGLYSELEAQGKANFWSALFSISVATALLILGPLYWMRSQGVDISSEIRSSVEALLTQIQTSSKMSGVTNAGIKVDADFILSQMPSVLFLLHLMSLAFALMTERKTALFFNLRYERIASQIKLLEFRLPDGLIWIAMLSFLGSFLKLDNKMLSTIAMNIFNVVAGLYFFQGLAVLEVLMLVFRMRPFTRLLIYVVIVGQLFLVLSAVGFIDYWADFRKRLRNLRMKENNQNNGEKI